MITYPSTQPPAARHNPVVTILALLFLCRLFFPQEASSGFIENSGMGPRASAMGNAFVGLADDGFALYYNPAGLAQIKGTTIGSGLEISAVRREYATGGVPIDSNPPIVVGPRTVITSDFGLERFTFGAGLMPSFAGFNMLDEFNGDARYSGYNTQEMVFPILIGTGYRVNDWLCLGAVLQIGLFNKLYTGRRMGDGFIGRSVEEMVGVPISTVNGEDDGKMEIQTDKEFPTGLRPLNSLNIDSRSFSYILGLLLRPMNKLQIGLTYREVVRAHYEGEARMILADEIKALLEVFGPVMELMGRTAGESARFNLLLKMPRQVCVGLAWFPTERLTITTDYSWTNWSTWESQTVNLEGDGLFGMTEITTPMDFSDTHSVRLGIDFALTSLFRLRAGYCWDPSPVPDHTIFMGTADSDRHVGTIGLALVGLKGGRLRIECSFQYVSLVTRTIAPGVSQNMGGYKNSLGNQYNDTEFQLGGYALKGALGWTVSF